VMVAGPKLKLSILTVVLLAGLSSALIAELGLVPVVKANAIARIAADPKISLILFIFFLLLDFSRKLRIPLDHASGESTIASECEPCT
jgi:hypothetical protein